MKIQTLIALFLSSVAVAEHPYDFVPDDALAILTIKDGRSINKILKSINEQSGLASAKPNTIETYLSQFVKDPSAIDLSSEAMIIVEPTKLAQGQEPTGMFGPMPHMMVICKEKTGHRVEATDSSGLKTTTTVDGWFIATGASEWTPRNSSELSPILDNLPDSQISSTVKFDSLWSQFGPTVQITGGMAVGMLNKPGPDGVISPETKKGAAAARKAFGALTAWCSTVKNLSMGIDFDGFTVVANLDVKLKEQFDLTIDNKSIEEMASLLTVSSMQYAMSGNLTRMLMEMDIESLRSISSSAEYGPPTILTNSVKALSVLVEDNVVSYGLSKQNGFTLTGLSDVSNQNKYLEDVSAVLDDFSGMLRDEYSAELIPTNSPYTWDVKMIGTDAEDLRVMNAVIHEDAQLRFQKMGNNRVMMSLGPQTWRPIGQPRSTPLSQVIRKYVDGVDIDFAMSTDARSFAVGFADVASVANPDEPISIGLSPSAKISLLIGKTNSGGVIEIQADLFGLATLISELNEVKNSSRD